MIFSPELGDREDSDPFFSRRIGIAKDLNGNNIQNKIIAGLRLSGKINKNLRIGVLNMQTDEDVDNEISAYNNTMIWLYNIKFLVDLILVFCFINRDATVKDYDFQSK